MLYIYSNVDTFHCKLNNQVLVSRLRFTLLYLVLWVGGVHDTAQLLACVNHNPHHRACGEGGEQTLRNCLVMKGHHQTRDVRRMFPKFIILTKNNFFK